MVSRLRLSTIMAVTLILAVLLAVGLATLFVNKGLGGRVNSFAHARLGRPGSESRSMRRFAHGHLAALR